MSGRSSKFEYLDCPMITSSKESSSCFEVPSSLSVGLKKTMVISMEMEDFGIAYGKTPSSQSVSACEKIVIQPRIHVSLFLLDHICDVNKWIWLFDSRQNVIHGSAKFLETTVSSHKNLWSFHRSTFWSRIGFDFFWPSKKCSFPENRAYFCFFQLWQHKNSLIITNSFSFESR